MITQATVATTTAGGGTLLDDDGRTLVYDAGVVDAAVRRLHVGQRVSVDVVSDRVVRLVLAGLPFT